MPRWVELLHSVLSGAVTADNMDYVRRDAYLCGVSLSAVDVPRLIYYSFCSPDGLTFHKRALNALRAFLNARFYMYENVYFHRIGHAIDLHMREIFTDTMALVLPQQPARRPARLPPPHRVVAVHRGRALGRRPRLAAAAGGAWPRSGSASSTAT